MASSADAKFNAKWRPILEAVGVARPGDVGWIHGANSQADLLRGLTDENVHFVEGDISAADGKVVMAHPPVTQSDLPFEEWLDGTVEAGKGAKLDFKSPDVMEHCLNYARQRAQGWIPLFVNADILPGPGGGSPRFEPKEFLRLCQELLPQAVLSLGWTVSDRGIGYTPEMLAEMRALLVDVDAPVTLCFHAWYLLTSWPEVKWLLDETDYTLTVWGKIADPELLRWLRTYANPRRCFYDVQRNDGAQVHLMGL